MVRTVGIATGMVLAILLIQILVTYTPVQARQETELEDTGPRALLVDGVWDAGRIEITTTGWNHIDFGATFTSAPTALVTISDHSEGKENDLRSLHSTNRTTTGFDVYSRYLGYVSWVAYGPGSGDDKVYEHGTQNVTAGEWTTVNLTATWNTAPSVVISQITDGEDARAASVKEVTTSDFKVYSKYTLNITWIAVGTGSGGSSDQIEYGVHRQLDLRNWTVVSYDTPFTFLPTVCTTQDNSTGNENDLRDSTVYHRTISNFSVYVKSGVCDLNWIAIGDRGSITTTTTETNGAPADLTGLVIGGGLVAMLVAVVLLIGWKEGLFAKVTGRLRSSAA
ncbi:MAG: hypothetical protein ACFFD9_05920 [Candidatus Thorarchaeota archaeon]